VKGFFVGDSCRFSLQRLALLLSNLCHDKAVMAGDDRAKAVMDGRQSLR
jgi:hypothetical protein